MNIRNRIIALKKIPKIHRMREKKRKNMYDYIIGFFIFNQDSNKMIADDDADMDEESERHLNSDVHVGQLLLDVNALDVKEKVKCTKL